MHRHGVDIVTDDLHGEFPLVTVEAREPSYIAFRWLPRGHSGPQDDTKAGTLVEFRLVPEGDHGVVVSVVESGFAVLDKPADQIRSMYHDTAEGWDIEMSALRSHLESR